MRLFVVLLALADCFGASAQAAITAVEHIVVIGCDGFGSLGFTPSNAPTLHQLMRTGASTLHARGVLPTISSPNWASMIMGAGPEQHGVTSNDWQPNKFDIPPVASSSAGIFPTIFGVVREQKPKAFIACVHDWEDFARLVEPRAPNLIEHVKGSPGTIRRACEVLRQYQPALLFIHLDDVDHAGHEFGWKSPEYFAAIETVDGLFANFLATLDATGLRGKTLLIMTADHGGRNKSHGDATLQELEIPWILNGPGVKRGHQIQSAVNTFDLAPTIAWVLGVQPPECWLGKPVTEAFLVGN